MVRCIVVLLCVVLLTACDDLNVKETTEYNGPLRKVENIELFYTENNRVTVKMKAPLLYEYANDDKEFPNGINMEFYKEDGSLESTLKANHAFYFKEKKLWRGRGEVEIKNIEKNEQLNSEELFWKQDEQRIYTEQFVTIHQQGDVVHGNGMHAKQDLSNYVITEVKGIITVDR